MSRRIENDIVQMQRDEETATCLDDRMESESIQIILDLEDLVSLLETGFPENTDLGLRFLFRAVIGIK